MMMPSATPRFEPMSIGMILDSTIRLYMRNMPLMIGIIMFSYLPYLALGVVIAYFVSSHQAGLELPIILGFGTTALWSLLAQPLAIGATTYAISEQYLDRQTSIVRALGMAWQRYRTLLQAQLIAGLVIMVGFALLVVPGILWTLSYALIAPVVMLEAVTAKQGRSRSWDLVSGQRGKVFGVLCVVLALTGIVSLGAQTLLPLLIDVDSLEGRMLLQVIGNLVSYVVIPIPTIANVLLYYDMRIRKEGFDLEMLSRTLALSQGVP